VIKMLSHFAEVREDLGVLLSRPMGPLVLEALQRALGKFKSLRIKWIDPRPLPVLVRHPALHPSPTKSIPVEIHEDREESEPIVPASRRKSVSTSDTYNTELSLPYRILWAKVIVRAAYDYALWKDSPDIRLRRFAEDAARWLFEPNPNLELSFENICFAFDFPVEKIRQKTRTLTREDVKKLEFRERQSRTELLGEISGGDGK
jgi:hypothetical protein